MKRLITVLLSVMVLMGLVAVPAFAAGPNDKLIVMDAGGLNPVFVVQNTGFTGIGTATPSSKLSVTDEATTANRGVIVSQNTTDGASAALILRKSRGTELAPTATSSGDYVGTFQFRGYDGSAFLRNGFIGSRVNGAVAAGSIPTDLFFAASATDTSDPFASGAVRMVIKSTGNVGVGTTAPTHLFQVGTAAYSDGLNWYPACSREYKENINDLTSREALSTLMGLNPVTYNYKVDAAPRAGFIAEDVPQLVGTPDRKSVGQLDILAILTKVVQDQNKTIEALSAKIDMLEKASR